MLTVENCETPFVLCRNTAAVQLLHAGTGRIIGNGISAVAINRY